MRVLVVAEDAEVRAARARDLERVGHEVIAADGAHLTARVRAAAPDALVVVAPASTSALRLLLGRARAAAEVEVPAVVLLDGGSLWLLLAGSSRTLRAATGTAVFERVGRRLAGPAGEVSLTPSEAAVLAHLAAQPGAFVSMAQLAHTLWGEASTDRYARGAIRTHIHTLRGKLAAAGVPDAIESRSAVGYRIAAGAVGI